DVGIERDGVLVCVGVTGVRHERISDDLIVGGRHERELRRFEALFAAVLALLACAGGGTRPERRFVIEIGADRNGAVAGIFDLFVGLLILNLSVLLPFHLSVIEAVVLAGLPCRGAAGAAGAAADADVVWEI